MGASTGGLGCNSAVDISQSRFGARSLVKVLWVWWSICAVLLLALWIIAFSNSYLYFLKSREANIYPRIQKLTQKFVALQNKQMAILLPLLKEFKADRLSRQRFADMRQEAAPLYRMYYTDTTAQPKTRPAEFMSKVTAVAWVAGAGNLFTIRSLPFEKESYLLTAVKNSRNKYLIAEANLFHIFGPWLKDQFHTLNFGPAVTYRVLPYREEKGKQNLRPDAPVPDLHPLSALTDLARGKKWDFLVPTFFPDDPNNFHRVLVTVDNTPELVGILKRYLAILAGGILLLGSFAISLYLAGLGVRRELELAEARSNFTAMVSHELKTPVAAIRMYAEILENRLIEDPAKIAEYHRIIGTEAERLKRLVENLLDLGKIERGARTYHLASEDLNQLVQEALQHARAPWGNTMPSLRLDLCPELPPALVDRDATVQAISNLVHNALKYGGDPPEVTVATRSSGKWLVVEVMDRGPGIPASKRKAVFEPFVRLESEDMRTSQGTGLGLALVKGYVEGQGGTVQVQERPGGGSIFSVTFNRAGNGASV